MATSKKTASTSKKKWQYVGGEPFEKPIFHVNNVEANLSMFDVQIRLNWAVESRDGVTMVVNHGTAAMSPQHAKSILEILRKLIETYEAEHGPIPPIAKDDQKH